MIRQRRCHHSHPGALTTMLLMMLWLSGCASYNGLTSQEQPDAADAYTQLGVAYLERSNLPRALNALTRALDISPDHAEAQQALALVYQQQGETALANEYFQKALQEAPGFTQARNNYAAFLYAQDDYRRACHQLDIASEDAQYPRRSQLFSNLGQCYIAQNNIDQARVSLQRAQQIDPRYARSYYLLAKLEFSQGNLSQAWQPLQTYLQLATPNQEALEMAIDIANRRGEEAMAADYRRQLGQLN